MSEEKLSEGSSNEDSNTDWATYSPKINSRGIYAVSWIENGYSRTLSIKDYLKELSVDGTYASKGHLLKLGLKQNPSMAKNLIFVSQENGLTNIVDGHRTKYGEISTEDISKCCEQGAELFGIPLSEIKFNTDKYMAKLKSQREKDEPITKNKSSKTKYVVGAIVAGAIVAGSAGAYFALKNSDKPVEQIRPQVTIEQVVNTNSPKQITTKNIENKTYDKFSTQKFP